MVCRSGVDPALNIRLRRFLRLQTATRRGRTEVYTFELYFDSIRLYTNRRCLSQMLLDSRRRTPSLGLRLRVLIRWSNTSLETSMHAAAAYMHILVTFCIEH
jgi:hypothetical protein